jgi:hypothetical protein
MEGLAPPWAAWARRAPSLSAMTRHFSICVCAKSRYASSCVSLVACLLARTSRQLLTAQYLNDQYAVDVPLVLMNSFSTHEETQKLLRKYQVAHCPIRQFNQVGQHPSHHHNEFETFLSFHCRAMFLAHPSLASLASCGARCAHSPRTIPTTRSGTLQATETSTRRCSRRGCWTSCWPRARSGSSSPTSTISGRLWIFVRFLLLCSDFVVVFLLSIPVLFLSSANNSHLEFCCEQQ